MSTRRREALPGITGSRRMAELRQYGCGPVEFTGTDNALYERHLLFDNVVKLAAAGAARALRGVARSVRDVLSQRWVLTEETYERENPKRVYYLSMEFLIGRSLANNVTNLLLDPLAQQAVDAEEPRLARPARTGARRGPGQRRAGRLAACFLDSMATHAAPGDGLRPALRIRHLPADHRRTAGSSEQPDNWLRRPDPWEVARPNEKVEVKLNCSFEVRGGTLATRFPAGRRRLIGIPFDRPVVGYGGKTINTLRLWAAAAPDYFDFQEFSSGDFVGALAETLAAESLTRVLYPGRFHEPGAGAALRAGVFPGRLLAGRSRAPLPPQQRRLEHAAGEGRHPAQRHAPGAWRSPS